VVPWRVADRAGGGGDDRERLSATGRRPAVVPGAGHARPAPAGARLQLVGGGNRAAQGGGARARGVDRDVGQELPELARLAVAAGWSRTGNRGGAPARRTAPAEGGGNLDAPPWGGITRSARGNLESSAPATSTGPELALGPRASPTRR
jgi:hypothetical protein